MAKLYSITINDDYKRNGKKMRFYQNKINVRVVNRDKFCNTRGVIKVKTVNAQIDKQLVEVYNPKYEKEYFYRAIGPVIRFAQIFTLMPISNVLSTNLNEIKFKWISIYTLVSIVGMVMGLFEFALFLYSVYGEKLSMNIIGDFIFYLTNSSSQMLLFHLSIRWSALLKQWYRYELVFLELPYKQLKYNLQFKVRLAAFTILFLAVGEHTLSIVQGVYSAYRRKSECNYNETVLQVLNVYSKYQYFEVFGFNTALIFFSEWVGWILTISWTFIDVIIVVISIGMISRFQQINNRIKSVERQSVSEIFWVNVRKHYIDLTDLINFVNNQIKYIVILSCSNNLYFICQQIYNSVSYFPFLLNKIYFWISLLFVIIRMFSVLFAAARINDVSVQSIEVLRQIPSYAWSVEAERFSEQLLYDCVAISGNNYFFITRRLIFAMLGSLITYEIVLLDQFDSSNINEEFCPKKIESVMYQG